MKSKVFNIYRSVREENGRPLKVGCTSEFEQRSVQLATFVGPIQSLAIRTGVEKAHIKEVMTILSLAPLLEKSPAGKFIDQIRKQALKPKSKRVAVRLPRLWTQASLQTASRKHLKLQSNPYAMFVAKAYAEAQKYGVKILDPFLYA